MNENQKDNSQGPATEPIVLPEISDEPEPSGNKQRPAGKKRSKLWLIVVVVVIVAIGTATGLVTLFGNKRSATPASDNKQTSNNDELSQTYKQRLPTNALYAYRASPTEPLKIYKRPAQGGDRSELTTLDSGNNYLSSYDASGKLIVFATDTAVYVSDDGGESVGRVYGRAGSELITSVKFSHEGSEVVIASAGESKNIVRQLNLSSKKVLDIFETSSRGVFVSGYSKTLKKILYREGCYNCDGVPGGLIARDTEDDAAKTIIEPGGYELQSVALDQAFKTIYYLTATYDESRSSSETLLAGFVGSPYSVKSSAVAGGEQKTIAKLTTVPAESGGLRVPYQTGFGDGKDGYTPYVAVGNILYAIGGGSSKILHEFAQPIVTVGYVSDSEAIVGLGTLDNWRLVRVSFAGDKETEILQGDGNTTLIGVGKR